MANIFDNKLLLQYLSAAGQDIGSGNPIGTNVNALTQSSIQEQVDKENNSKTMQALAKMLSGEVPEGGSITKTDKGLNIKLPNPSLDSGTGASGSGQVTGENASMLETMRGGDYNLGSMSPTDLSNLTPEILFDAIGRIQNKRQLDINQQQADTSRMGANLAVWKAANPTEDKTTAIQNYEYYVNQQKSQNKTPKNFDEWDKDTRTTHQKEYEQAVSDGYTGGFQEWLRDITALGGGLSLGEYRARKEIEDVQENKNYFAKDLSTDIDKYINSEDVQNELFQLENTSQRNLAKGKKEASYIEQQIISKGATIEDVKRSGDTFTWIISWPDGSTQKVNRIIKLGSK